MTPVPVGPSRYDLDSGRWPEDDLIGEGADLEPETLLDAYRRGAFPMPDVDTGRLLWWSPLERGVLRPGELRVSRSLRRSARRYTTTIDTAFDRVVRACADPERDGAWISADIARAYRRLHALGWAHSVETWDDEGRLVGGLYGVAIGGLFAGESMFHAATDASKVALMALVAELSDGEDRLIDTQWQTPHLASLGVGNWPRERYLATLGRLTERVALPRRWR